AGAHPGPFPVSASAPDVGRGPNARIGSGMSIGSFSASLLHPPAEGGHPSAASRVYAGLRSRIISLQLLPDTTLSRSEIAERYEVSQSPVREAIQRLEKEGLVISYPQSRTVVSKIDIAHARETQFLRVSVEIEV